MESTTPETPVLLSLDPTTVRPSWRARKDYGDIDELAESIKAIGQLHPIVVRKKEDGSYAIIAGMRRLRACKSLGFSVLAVVAEPKDELDALTMQLSENVKRKNFDRLEVGEGLKRLKRLYDKDHPEATVAGTGFEPKGEDGAKRFSLVAAKTLSVSEATVFDLLGIAALPQEDKQKIREAKTTKERNVEASRALGKVRKQKKVQKLEQQAQQRQAERESEAAAGEEEAKVETKKAKKEEPTVFMWLGPMEKILADEGFKESSIDACITDPPYGKARTPILFSGDRAAINEEIKWDELDVGWIQKVVPLLTSGGTLLAFCPMEAVGDYELAVAAAGLVYRGCIVWHKVNPAPAVQDTYSPSVEAIVWATKGRGYYWRPGNKGRMHNHLEGPICGGLERLDHPTQKPLWLIKKLLRQHVAKGDRVLDPFIGTGTTAVAAKELGMICYGIEKSPKYLRLAKLRLAAL